MKTQLQQLRQVISRYPQALKLVWQANPRYTLFIAVLTLVSSVTAPAQIWLTKVLIDRVSMVVQGAGQGTVVDWSTILPPTGATVAQPLQQGIGSVMSRFVTQRQNAASYKMSPLPSVPAQRWR